MTLGMTIQQAAITWLAFIVAAAAIGVGVVWIMVGRQDRGDS